MEKDINCYQWDGLGDHHPAVKEKRRTWLGRLLRRPIDLGELYYVDGVDGRVWLNEGDWVVRQLSGWEVWIARPNYLQRHFQVNDISQT